MASEVKSKTGIDDGVDDDEVVRDCKKVQSIGRRPLVAYGSQIDGVQPVASAPRPLRDYGATGSDGPGSIRTQGSLKRGRDGFLKQGREKAPPTTLGEQYAIPGPRIKKPHPTLEPSSIAVIVGRREELSDAERDELRTRIAAIQGKSHLKRGTVKSYLGDAKYWEDFCFLNMHESDTIPDSVVSNMPKTNHKAHFKNFVCYLPAKRGIRGQRVSQILSATRAYLADNAPGLDMAFCDPEDESIKKTVKKASEQSVAELRAKDDKRKATVKLVTYEGMVKRVEDQYNAVKWDFEGTIIKVTAIGCFTQDIVGVRVSSVAATADAEHEMHASDVHLRFAKEEGKDEWILELGGPWNDSYFPCHIVEADFRSLTDKYHAGTKTRCVPGCDVPSWRLIRALAEYAYNVSIQPGDPFLVSYRTDKKGKVHRRVARDSDINLMIKDGGEEEGFSRKQISSHCFRGSQVTKDKIAQPEFWTADRAKMGNWSDASSRGAMRHHYDKSVAVYRQRKSSDELTREQVMSMLPLSERHTMTTRMPEVADGYKPIRRTNWSPKSSFTSGLHMGGSATRPKGK